MTNQTPASPPRIGFAGLGLMGSGMARNFLTKGYPLTVWNRTRAATEPLARDGAKVAASPRELAAASDVVVTSLSTPEAVAAVALGEDGLLAGARPGLRWIETSTIGPKASRHLAAAARVRGLEYLEAPVTGSKNGARDGTLLVMTGGPQSLHDELEPVIRAFAAKVIRVGDTGQAAVMKLIGNSLISFMLEGLSEAAVMGEKSAIPMEKILEVVQASGFASPYWSFKGTAMARRDFETHFSLDLLHKDQALMLALAEEKGVTLPGLAKVHEMTGKARALGFGGEDIAAQIKAVEKS
jgi:3-hydroxyisobutyrate dehydrogenase-like beta-hydroxyacid dehydrogenase